MSARGPITRLIVPARTLAGRPIHVAVELLDTEGGPQIAVSVGEDGEKAILPEMATSELVISISQMVVEKNRYEAGQ
jgi:hypothetical protein